MVTVLALASCQLVFAQDYQADVRPVLQEFCFKCHGPDEQESDLRLDSLKTDFSDGPTAGAWIEVRDNINLGEMPPDGEPRPSAAQQVLISKWIQGQLRAMQAQKNSSGGKVQLRRLSRTEYVNTVRDLLKVTFVEGNTPREILPPDGTLQGFDKLSKALLLDPSLMENYFAAAKLVADRAIRVKPPRVPTMKDREQFEDRIHGGRTVQKTKTGVLLYSGNIRTGAHTIRHPYAAIVDPYGKGQFPASGRYAVRARAGADRGSRPDEPIYMDLRWTQGQSKRFEVTAPISRPEIYEWIVDIDVSENGELNVVFVNGLRFSRAFSDSGVVANALRKAQGEGDVKKANIIRARGRAQGIYDNNTRDAPTRETRDLSNLPRIFVDWLELEGPLQESFPPASTNHIFHDGFDDPKKHTPEYARAILTRLLPRAFRRPVTTEEIDTYANLVAGELKRGNSFASALKTGLVAVLCTPDFLHIFEPKGLEREASSASPARDLNDFELASRLSYFLWSSMPDDELFSLAKASRLSEPATLRAQVDRMLADPNSEALVRDFASQWLKVAEFDRFIPDEYIYRDSFYSPQFGGIGPDMEEEAYAFFREVLQKDESVLSFLDSNWIMANERLAGFYGVDGVKGEQFRRVRLPENSPRGGILGMAGFHKWGSDGNRTKPVERGKYILTVLFNDPPDPPPPNAGEVEPNIKGERLTVRERLLQHQQVEACAGCHRTIDPYGLAMENFNAVGQWRDAQDGEGDLTIWGRDRPPIITEDTLPNGKGYKSFAEFKKLIVEQAPRFERGLAEKMMIYALGRTLEPTDDAVLQKIVTDMGTSGHTLKSLIHGIVATKAFRTK